MRVRGIGPVPCPTMLVGEAPGREEDERGVPFCGMSGKDLTRYLKNSRLWRNEIYVTNLVKIRPQDNADPTQQEIERDEPELYEELNRVRPAVIGAIGRIATEWLLGKRFISMEL